MEKIKRARYSMTEGPLWTGILLFSLPLVLSQILQVLFNMADVAVVGRYSGAAALGAVGSTTILVTLFVGFFIGFGSGVNARVAVHLGEQSDKDVSETVHTAFSLCALFGVGILLFCFFGAKIMLSLLHTKEELFSGALLYFRIYAFAMPAVSLFNFGNGVMSAMGDTKRPLAYLTAAGVANVALNLLFVLVLHMSVDGVALASVLSQYLAAGMVLTRLLREKGPCGLRIKKIGFYPGKSSKLLVLCVPAGLQNAIFEIANLFVQTAVNSFDAVMVEGNSAAVNSDPLVYNVMAAFYTGCTTFMAQNRGALNRRRVLKSYFISLVYSFGIAAILGTLLLVFGRQFLYLFTKEPAVVEAGLTRLRVMAFSYAVSAFMDCTIAASRGIGKTVVPTVLVILGSCVFRIVWIYTVFARFGTILSLYSLYIFSWTITSIMEIIYFVFAFRRLDFTKAT